MIKSILVCTDGSEYGNWRLPNVRELQSLIDYGQTLPALPSDYGTYFTGVQSDFYWSNTTYVAVPSGGWIVDLNRGNAGLGLKTSAHYMWPVRGGQ